MNENIEEVELPFDFDADFGVEGVNVIVRQMLKEERANNFVAFNAEYDRLKAEHDEELSGHTEREIQLKRQNEVLQGKLTQALSEYDKLVIEIGQVGNRLRESEERNEEIEQNRKNAATQIGELQDEIERLERLADEQRIQFNFGEKGLQRTIDVTETTQSLYEQAKQATAEKRKVMVTAEIGLYREVQGADGVKEMVHHSELWDMDIVDSLPDIEAPELTGGNAGGTFQGEPISLPESTTEIQQGTDATDHADQESPVGENEPQTLETRVAILEQSNLEMQTWIDSIEKRVGALDGNDSYNNDDFDIAS